MNHYHHQLQAHQPGLACTTAATAPPILTAPSYLIKPQFTASNNNNTSNARIGLPPDLLHFLPNGGATQHIGPITGGGQLIPAAFYHDQNQQRHISSAETPANRLAQHRPGVQHCMESKSSQYQLRSAQPLQQPAGAILPPPSSINNHQQPIPAHFAAASTAFLPTKITVSDQVNHHLNSAIVSGIPPTGYQLHSAAMANTVLQQQATAAPTLIATTPYQQQHASSTASAFHSPCPPPIHSIILHKNNNHQIYPPIQQSASIFPISPMSMPHFPPPAPLPPVPNPVFAPGIANSAAAATLAPAISAPQTAHGSSQNGQLPGIVENVVAAGPGDCWSTAVTGWEQAALIKNKIGLIINARFRILQSIASGSYGEIFAAEDLHSVGPKRARVAVKFDGACRDNHLRYEYQVYKSALYEDGNGKVDGFPQVFWYGHEYGHNIMVMELLGAPVASLFAFCDRKFARQTIVSLGEQMILRIRHLHQRGFIHRDIKPENFLMGLAGRESTLYLIDFGLARRYRYREGENRALTHIPYRRGRSFIGTAKYASLNSHKNIELSRRDDLESLAYVLIELVNGHLPWKNIHKRNATTRHVASQRIRQLKEQTNWEEFCPCLAKFMRYCREIPFNEEPDYDKLLDLLQPIAFSELIGPSTTVMLACRQGCAAVNPNRNNKHCAVASSITATICCQTTETAEKMIQVDMVEKDANVDAQRVEEKKIEKREEEQNVSSIAKFVVESIQRQLSMNVGETTSDFDEVGAATTTTSCSENELDSGAGGVTTQSGTGTADDEDSQPTPQQEQQICRKCRRLRDQAQKSVKESEKQQQRSTKPEGQQQSINRVDMGLQTDLIVIEQQLETVKQQQSTIVVKQQPMKMCWQSARESNAERKFQYENKFSWTLPLQTDQQQISLVTSTGGYQNQHAPPSFMTTSNLPLLPTNPQMLQTIAPFQPTAMAKQQTCILASNYQQQQMQPTITIGGQFRQHMSSAFASPLTGSCIPPPGMGMAQSQRLVAATTDVSLQQFLFTAGPPPPIMMLPVPRNGAMNTATKQRQNEILQQQPLPTEIRHPLQASFVFPPPLSGTRIVVTNTANRNDQR